MFKDSFHLPYDAKAKHHDHISMYHQIQKIIDLCRFHGGVLRTNIDKLPKVIL